MSTVNLGQTKILTAYHAALLKLTGIAIDYTGTDGRNFSLCDPGHCSPLCRLIRRTREGLARCDSDDRRSLAETRFSRRPQVYRCHAGLVDLIVPLFVRDVFIGALSAGQVMTAPPFEEGFREFLAANPYLAEVDPEELRRGYFNCRVCTAEQLEALTELLSLVGNYVVESESRLSFLESVHEKKPIQAARDYIELNYAKNLKVADIAARVAMSESHFGHLFKRETGVTPIRYLNRVRIGRAIELLASDRRSIAEIAFRCGFANLTHFNRVFRQLTGKTPSDYRRARPGE